MNDDSTDVRTALRMIVEQLPLERDHKQRLLEGLSILPSDRARFALESFELADAALSGTHRAGRERRFGLVGRKLPREHATEDYRNFGIMTGTNVSKRMMTELILYHTRKLHKVGEFTDDTAAMDWIDQERGKFIATTAFWKSGDSKIRRFNIVDTPDHGDFTNERSLRVLDGAITLVDTNTDVEQQIETIWYQADKYHVPRVIFCNNMDKPRADFLLTYNMIKSLLSTTAVAVQLPIGSESDFKGIIDLIEMKALIWRDKTFDAAWDIVDIPADMQAAAAEWRNEMVEQIIQMNSDAIDNYREGNMPSNDELRALIRKGTIALKLFPIFCGSAFKNRGIQPLLDGIVQYMPSPIDVPAITGIDPETKQEIVRKSSDDEPLSMLAFKIMSDPIVGSLTFCRIYSGKLVKGDMIENTVKGKREHIGRMLQMQSNSGIDIDEAFTGDIVVLTGLESVTAGDTLCDPLKPIILERMEFPEPVIHIAIEPKNWGDRGRMGFALDRLAAEDPSLHVKTDNGTGQMIIGGKSEPHLYFIVDRMRREFAVEANIGAPQAAYRETITLSHEQDYMHKKLIGGTGQFARVVLLFEPTTDGEDFVFESKIVGGTVPKEYIPGVEKGIMSVMGSGPAAGFPMTGVKVTLIDGAYHEVDSSVLAFEIASRAAFREAMPKLGVKLLEPIMKVEVVTPEDYIGSIIGDLNSRRGQIYGTESRGVSMVISAMVPLANMFKYLDSLRSMSQGRAQYTMTFDHYAAMPIVAEAEDSGRLTA